MLAGLWAPEDGRTGRINVWAPQREPGLEAKPASDSPAPGFIAVCCLSRVSEHESRATREQSIRSCVSLLETFRWVGSVQTDTLQVMEQHFGNKRWGTWPPHALLHHGPPGAYIWPYLIGVISILYRDIIATQIWKYVNSCAVCVYDIQPHISISGGCASVKSMWDVPFFYNNLSLFWF